MCYPDHKQQPGQGTARPRPGEKTTMCKIHTLQARCHAPSLLTCSHKTSLGGVLCSRGWAQKELPGRRSGCLQWLHCGFAAGRPACCSCIAGEGTVGHTPVGASPSLSGEMTENKEIRVRGWELAIHRMASIPNKTQSPLQSTEELEAFASLFWLFCVFHNAYSRPRTMNTRGSTSILKCSTFWMLSPPRNAAVHLTAATAS